ncbi:hypothetical protein P153DRAFT_383960 [Dothidotthia symphoricarpi CBS 119687]|uniref:Uncharacterized protein n=1 Tax=Dothidotthia symphoricarpi CBS 119687 TaxID=1392245 RepID=A0A6A6AI12_9PLEO|nr:uncharacterized protein P153DRAFT_383960 [Dothidotthia symphoricarpi CBS 119687]KAF2130735.1 hypothetical protein P153DRAFT_383960 [Dothidotthia symphoricarpi CBS 119687]
MAGRILPVALAAVVGVSIGIATFDEEFKAQRMERLQKEYDQEVAAAAALNSEGPSPMASSAASSPAPEKLQAKKEEIKASASPTPSASSTSSWSSLLGLWAWKKDAKRETTPAAAPAKDITDAAKGKP